LLGARSFVGSGVILGAECRLGPGAVVLEGSRIGDRVRIGPGAIIGSEGFGFVADGPLPRRMPQVGGVVLEDDVEIGALTAIDRATIGDTIIRRGAKLDNLIQVGHNAEIGAGALMAAQCGLAGSSKVGAGAQLGGQVGVGDHLRIGSRARLAGKSGVTADVPDGATYAGYPALPRFTWLRAWATLLRRGMGTR
jgi:UDP-3-O-[3-hydroxymyristoyl] glucosamine N-acyltransferase